MECSFINENILNVPYTPTNSNKLNCNELNNNYNMDQRIIGPEKKIISQFGKRIIKSLDNIVDTKINRINKRSYFLKYVYGK